MSRNARHILWSLHVSESETYTHFVIIIITIIIITTIMMITIIVVITTTITVKIRFCMKIVHI